MGECAWRQARATPPAGHQPMNAEGRWVSAAGTHQAIPPYRDSAGGGLTPAGEGVSTQTLDSPDSRPLVPTEPDLPPALLH